MGERMPVLLARVQGWFYVLTGLWAIVDIGSFQAVTGPKTDLWLVKTVGVLVGVIIIAIASPLGLAAIDLIYALGGRISAKSARRRGRDRDRSPVDRSPRASACPSGGAAIGCRPCVCMPFAPFVPVPSSPSGWPRCPTMW
jgi:hypothetical protein